MGLVGKLWSLFVGVAILCGFVYWMAGPAVSQALAGNTGNAAGAGVRGGVTFFSSMGDGWTAADTMQARLDAADAEKRAKAAEDRAKRAEERARAARGSN